MIQDFKAKKTLGQNFLINKGVLKKIVEAGDLTKEDTVLEVGPGTGNLTELLSAKVKKVIAIERDYRLIEPLKERFKNSNVEIIEEDILKLKIENLKLKINDYKIVANIPYYITSHFIKKTFEEWPKPKLIVLTIQKEVAQRIMAKPPHMNILALSVQYYSQPEIISYVSAGSFRPSPKVDSAVIKLVPHQAELIENSKNLFGIIHAGFQGKRKVLISNLSKNLNIEKPVLEEYFKNLEINTKIRAESLSLQNWISLTWILSQK